VEAQLKGIIVPALQKQNWTSREGEWFAKDFTASRWHSWGKAGSPAYRPVHPKL